MSASSPRAVWTRWSAGIGFDFVKDLGAVMPLRVVGMLFGIPEDYQHRVQEDGDNSCAPSGAANDRQPRRRMTDGQVFAEFIDWRVPTIPPTISPPNFSTPNSTDETGTRRRLHRDELLMFMNVVAVAGAETTTRLIGWAGKLLSEHPDQRRRLVADRSLLPGAIEEILRFEPPALQAARYVTRDVEFHGTDGPRGQRDHPDLDRRGQPRRTAVRRRCRGLQHHPRAAPAPDVRGRRALLPGQCAGAHRGRIALDEIMNRFPDWEVDLDDAVFSSSSAVRGWDSMPARVRIAISRAWSRWARPNTPKSQVRVPAMTEFVETLVTAGKPTYCVFTRLV